MAVREWNVVASKRIGLTGLWIIGGLLVGVSALHALKSGNIADAIFAGTSSMFLTIIGGLTIRGSFERHLGGWLTYVGIVFAYLGAAGLAMWVSSYFIHRSSVNNDLAFVAMCVVAATLFLVLGARRHASRSRALLDARTLPSSGRAFGSPLMSNV